jgi:hypothetical protein
MTMKTSRSLEAARQSTFVTVMATSRARAFCCSADRFSVCDLGVCPGNLQLEGHFFFAVRLFIDPREKRVSVPRFLYLILDSS